AAVKSASVKSQPRQHTAVRSMLKHTFTDGRRSQQHAATCPAPRGQHVVGQVIVQSSGTPPPTPFDVPSPSSPHPT
ncbi:MAG: hypothetical protein L0Y56_18800, partial [Nitrospira sp.]|nr:hypothetical protein [Nitrospira sp.]